MNKLWKCAIALAVGAAVAVLAGVVLQIFIMLITAISSSK
jgi:hypothetical protein